MQLRKLFTAFVTIGLVLTGFTQISPASAAACTSGGTGTALDPYVICTNSDFSGIASHTSAHFKLGNDLDFTGYTPPTTNFSGEFDGNGKTISNFSKTITSPYDGLFHYIFETGYVHDFFLKDIALTVNNASYAGSIAGDLYGRLERVQVSGTISTNSQYTAGVVGCIDGDATMADVVTSVTIKQSVDAYAYSVASIVWGGDPQNGGDGIPQISNVIATSPGNRWAFPEYMPWFDHMSNQGPGMPDCSVFTSVFSLADDSGATGGCGTRLRYDALVEAGPSTSGFSSFDVNTWNFGDQGSLPFLTEFPQAPGAPKGVSVVSVSGTFAGQIMPGFDGGSAITRYDVQIRRVGGEWRTPPFQMNGAQNFIVYDVNAGDYYDVRVRAVNTLGFSDWAVTREAVTPDDSNESITVGGNRLLSVNTGTLVQPQLSQLITLANGNLAIAYTEIANGQTLVALKIFTPAGRLRTEVSADVTASYDSTQILTGINRIKLTPTPEGGLAIAYVVSSVNGNNVTSKVKVVTSSPAYGLGVSVEALASRTIDKSQACGGSNDCAYDNLNLAVDASGAVAVLASYPTVTGGSSLVLGSQKGAGAWSSGVLDTASGFNSQSLITTAPGFVAGWVTSGSSQTAKYTVLKKAGTTTWLVPQVIESGSQTMSGRWVNRTAKVASFVWSFHSADLDGIKVRDFDLAKLKFLKPAVVVANTDSAVASFAAAASQTGELTVALDDKEDGSNNRRIRVVQVNAANVQTNSNTFGGYVGSAYNDLELNVSANGTPLVTWRNTVVDGPQVFVAKRFDANFVVRQLPIQAPMAVFSRAALLGSGDAVVVSVGKSGSLRTLEMTNVLTNTAPTVAGTMTIAGTAKVGKALTATFAGWNSFSPITKQAVQWYRCTQEMGGIPDPISCTAIPKATALTYKAVKADKGKWLTVTVRGTNSIGTAVGTPASVAVN